MRTAVRQVMTALLLAILGAWTLGLAPARTQAPYYPPAGQWARKMPAEVGMDGARLTAAIEFMKAHETASPARDFSDQEVVFGKLLGSIPTERAATNGLVIRHVHRGRVRRHAAA